MSDNAKTPIVIPKNSFIGDLIILDAHKKVLHQGVKDTLNEVRSEYWIISGRSSVKKVIKRCYLCQKHDAKPFQRLPDGPLPEFCCTYGYPFTNTGID